MVSEAELPLIHVAAGVIRDGAGRILLARRPPHLAEGGLWEFPGGKREPGETRFGALEREIEEELSIRVERATPLIRVPHRYPYGRVQLDVWSVDAWQGDPHPREGQQLAWVEPGALGNYAFPAANASIVTAVRLPRLYAVTPEPGVQIAPFLDRLARLLDSGIELVQLRAKALPEQALLRLVECVLPYVVRADVRLMLNASPALALASGAHGVHLSSARLLQMNARPARPDFWVAASCHNRVELAHAMRIGVDFAVVGPVRETQTHPQGHALGWRSLLRLIRTVTLPVYALGGMQPEDLTQAVRIGCQGIAATRSLWAAPDIDASMRAVREAITAASNA